MGQFEIFKGNDKQWYWRLIARNGEIVCQSEGYKRKDSVVKAIKRLPELAATEKVVEVVE
jgi:uncharacterized protein YegP (UPF0339 family)